MQVGFQGVSVDVKLECPPRRHVRLRFLSLAAMWRKDESTLVAAFSVIQSLVAVSGLGRMSISESVVVGRKHELEDEPPQVDA